MWLISSIKTKTMEEIEVLLTATEPYESQIVCSLVTFFITVMVMKGNKKKPAETPIQTRFSSLQNRLIKALELEETAFLTEATAIHEEYKALLAAYQMLHGEQEQKK
jgi:hypothetical protein